jgi:hypothetical protein
MDGPGSSNPRRVHRLEFDEPAEPAERRSAATAARRASHEVASNLSGRVLLDVRTPDEIIFSSTESPGAILNARSAAQRAKYMDVRSNLSGRPNKTTGADQAPVVLLGHRALIAPAKLTVEPR